MEGVLIGISKAEARVREARHFVARPWVCRHSQALGLCGIRHAGHRIEHGRGAREARERPGYLDDRELRHHHEEEDEHGVLEQRGDGTNLHGTCAHAVRAHPHDKYLDNVHKEERRAVYD